MTVEPRTRSSVTGQDATSVTLGQIFEQLFGPDTPVRFEAYDGSRAGDPDAPILIRLVHPRAVSYVVTAPGSLGLARAYLQGDLEIEGVHPGDPYELLKVMEDLHARRPSPAEVAAVAALARRRHAQRRLRCRTSSRSRPAGSASACGTAGSGTPPRSATTTTSPTTSTSWCSARR